MYSSVNQSQRRIGFGFGTDGNYDINLNFSIEVNTPTGYWYEQGSIGPARFSGMNPGQLYYPPIQMQQGYGITSTPTNGPSEFGVSGSSHDTTMYYNTQQTQSGFGTPLTSSSSPSSWFDSRSSGASTLSGNNMAGANYIVPPPSRSLTSSSSLQAGAGINSFSDSSTSLSSTDSFDPLATSTPHSKNAVQKF